TTTGTKMPLNACSELSKLNVPNQKNRRIKMAHKGYTLNYFIDFFKNIPDHRWTEGRLQEYGTVQKCALGHAASNLRAEADSEVDLDTVNSSERVTALQEFLNDKTANINDGVG